MIHAPVSSIRFAGGLALCDERHQRVHICNESAGAMWSLLAQGLSEAQAVLALSEGYGVSAAQVEADLALVLAAWRRGGLIDGGESGPSEREQPAEKPRRGEARVGCYDLDGHGFVVVGAETTVMDHLEAALEPFRSGAARSPTELEIGIEPGAEPFVLRKDGVERLRVETTAEIIGGVFQSMLETVYPDTEWLALIHAAAVARPGGDAVLLPGEGGSGKSTLAAWLARRGFDFHADDMVALGGPDGHIVPWPLPHSVKRGSWSALAAAIPELDALPSRAVNGREIKFVAAPGAAWRATPAPVGAIVFPSYDSRSPAGTVELSMLDKVERLLGGRIWLGERLTRERIEAFLRWLEPIPAYAVTYNSLPQAEGHVRAALG